MRFNINVIMLFIEVLVNKGYTRRKEIHYSYKHQIVKEKIIDFKAALMIDKLSHL